MLPQSVLEQALAAEGGSTAKGEATELDDAVEFMTPEEVARQERMAQGGYAGSGLEVEELSEHRGKDDGHHASRGMKQARMAAEARASIQQRLEALLNGTKKAAADVKLGALVEEDDEPLVAGSGPTRFKQFRPKKTEEEKEAQRAAAAAAAEAARSAQELDDIITGLMGTSAAAAAAAPEPDVATQVAALRAELEAMGDVEDWEQAADAEVRLEEL
jgi:hypothetical protein